jgi:hypothetical protein
VVLQGGTLPRFTNTVGHTVLAPTITSTPRAAGEPPPFTPLKSVLPRNWANLPIVQAVAGIAASHGASADRPTTCGTPPAAWSRACPWLP